MAFGVGELKYISGFIFKSYHNQQPCNVRFFFQENYLKAILVCSFFIIIAVLIYMVGFVEKKFKPTKVCGKFCTMWKIIDAMLRGLVGTYIRLKLKLIKKMQKNVPEHSD